MTTPGTPASPDSASDGPAENWGDRSEIVDVEVIDVVEEPGGPEEEAEPVETIETIVGKPDPEPVSVAEAAPVAAPRRAIDYPVPAPASGARTSSLLEDTPEDLVRRQGLRKMRIVATSLLVFAAFVFLVTGGNEPKSLLGFINTAAEAAMVGALADWFAVTALFRHPLGIPIPHTALIKRRKNDLGRSLQQFVTANFLTEAVVRQRLEQTDSGLRLAEWLGEERNRRRVLTEVVGLARKGLVQISDDDVRTIVEDSLVPRLMKEDLAPVAGSFLCGIVADGSHHGLVELLLRELDLWVMRNPDRIQKLIGDRSPLWSPGWVEKMVGRWGYDQIQTWIRQVRDNPRHEVRIALDDLLADFAHDLQSEQRIRAKAEEFKVRMLSHDSLADTIVRLWDSIRDSLLGALDDESGSLWRRADGWLAEFAEQLSTDEELRTRLEQRFNDIVCYLVQRYGPELAGVISHTVESWDADEASRKIELFVGRDLQFIRINGTIVGALAGLAIHTVAVLIH